MNNNVHIFGKNNPIITLVCGVHGEEDFGLKVYHHLLSERENYEGIKLILAHPYALSKRVRYIDTDLNRSFPGRADGSLEERLAHSLKKEIQDTPYLLDVHTTVSDIQMAPIIVHLNKITKKVINICDVQDVAYIQPPLAHKSLIGQTAGGVSLEFNQDYAKTERALTQLLLIVRRLLDNKVLPRQRRRVYYVNGVINKDLLLSSSAKNFRKIRSLGVYPFLLHPDAYPDIHALSAVRKEYRVI